MPDDLPGMERRLLRSRWAGDLSQATGVGCGAVVVVSLLVGVPLALFVGAVWVALQVLGV